MDNSIYITLTRQLALFRDMEATANNVANANTTGYAAEHAVFASFMAQDITQGDPNPMSFGYDISTFRDDSEGEFKSTGNDLDIAIHGNGYFTLETPLGLRYTRAGNFRLSPDGTLVTSDGYPVLDSAGQHIVFDEATRTIQVGEAGNIKVNGQDFATLSIAQFDNPKLLERLNSSMFRSNVKPHQSDTARVVQGMLESSNVQPVKELTHMMNVQHNTTDTAQFISIVYELERKAADAWAQQS
jgi:flagellar basal-body rod protein FlgF